MEFSGSVLTKLRKLILPQRTGQAEDKSNQVMILDSASNAIRPQNSEKSPDIARFLAASDSTNQIVVIIGRAGTGKTTLIRQVINTSTKKQVVVAPTGVAALNVGGQTIHSFFRIPPRITNASELEPVRGSHHLFKNLERLIIDEISMVRADLLDNIDQALRLNRHSDLPFGGIQIVMVGDFLQLPPVIPIAEAEMLAEMGYKTPYALSVFVV